MTSFPLLWRSDFENTVSPHGWTGINLVGNGPAVSMDRTARHHGYYGMLSTLGANNASTTGFAQLYYTLPVAGNGHNHYFGRVEGVRIDALPLNNDTFGCYIMIFQGATGGTGVGGIGFRNTGGTLQFSLFYRTGGANLHTRYGTALLNTPYCLELEIMQSTVGNADGEARMWVNGDLIITQTGLDNDDRNMSYLTAGMGNVGTGANGVNVRLDCYAVANNKRLGCERALRECLSHGYDSRIRARDIGTFRQGTRMGLK